MKTRYVHTVNGQPAHFNGRQIVYGRQVITAVTSLRQIRNEQKTSTAYRRAQGWKGTDGYGYLRVAI